MIDFFPAVKLQMEESARPDEEIKKNLEILRYKP